MVRVLGILGRGVRLRCPHCGEGQLAAGLFRLHATCSVCGVRYERKPGESSGASIFWAGLLPIVALLVFFALYAADPTLPLALTLGISIGVVVVLGLLGYRHARGVWIAVVELTEGLRPDAEQP